MDKCIKNILDYIKNYIHFEKEYYYDFIVENLCFKNIFTLEKIPQITKANKRAIWEMNVNEKNEMLKGLGIISEYNHDFDKLSSKYLTNSRAPSFTDFKSFLREERSGFYLKKAWKNYIIRNLLVLLQLLILHYNYPKYFCDNELVEGNSDMFWIYKNEKYKVLTIIRDKLFYLRIK